MTIPDYQTVMLPLLRLAADEREHFVREAVEELAREFKLSEEERKELLPSGESVKPTLYNWTCYRNFLPLLPLEGGKRGGQWRDHRTVINGILWKLRIGSPWRDLPERCGPWQTCFDRFNRWRRDGTWDRLLTNAQTKRDAIGNVEWEVSVDDTVIRAHQHAAGARRELAKNEDVKEGS